MATCKQCGTYKGPGKFEGEPCYVLFLWGGELDYDFYDGETPVSRVTVDADLVSQFPCSLEVEDVGRVILLWEDGQGFVNSRIVSPKEAELIEAECQESEEKEEGV